MTDEAKRLQAFRLDGKRAVVTGAGRGIGAAVARGLAGAGAMVAVNDVVAARAAAVAAEIDGAVASVGDASEPAAVARLFEEAVGAFGGVDVVVCNAGVTLAKTAAETAIDEWDLVLRTNLTGAFLCGQQALKVMAAQGGGGRIVFMGSVVAHQGALQGHVAYAASKGGVHALAKTLALTGAPMGVTVNVIAPGPIDTEMLRGAHAAPDLAAITATMPLGVGAVDDVAAATVFLASDGAAHITGATLDVNGGMVRR